MQFKYLNKIIVNSSKTVKNVLNTFNSTAQYTDGAFIIVVNDQGACLGVITDGDIPVSYTHLTLQTNREL